MVLVIVGLDQEVYDLCILMCGWMIYVFGGVKWLLLYSGWIDEYINLIFWLGLNVFLLEKVDFYDNLMVFFE